MIRYDSVDLCVLKTQKLMRWSA